jgi:hypothetical protein
MLRLGTKGKLTMIRMHASSKSIVRNGAIAYLPMITLRADKGRMVGCKVPQGVAQEFRTFTTSDAAREAARAIALRCAADFPGILIAA